VDAGVILDVLSRGLAANRVMELRRDNFVSHAFAPGFRVDLHHKDLDIALTSGGQANVPLPLTAGVQQLFRQLRAAGWGGQDHTAIFAAVEALSWGPETSLGTHGYLTHRNEGSP
jgi:2-hydroxy-3-oxopropionate reductase